MPRVAPFAGLRYAPERVPDLASVVSPPYDVIDPDAQVALRAASDYNAIHLELPADLPGQPGTRYAAAHQALQTWRQSGVLRQDPAPAYYLSETTFTYQGTQRRRRDLLASIGVEPWSTGAILPHERTMRAPKADRLELLRATHANSSPIWVLYRDQLPAVEAAWSNVDARPPTAEFTWRGEHHRVWVVADATRVRSIQTAFEAGGPLYIADGHHRYETSLAFRDAAGATIPGADGVLAAVTWAGDPGLHVLPTHRILRQLRAGTSLADAATRWSSIFRSTTLLAGDSAPSECIERWIQTLAAHGGNGPAFGLYDRERPDAFEILEVRDPVAAAAALPADRSAAWKALDVSLLHTLLVDPLIEQGSTAREEVLAYTREPAEAVEAVRRGSAAGAFFLNATPVSGVLAIADAHDRMPEKSTYFYPKPPAGVVIRDLDSPP